LCASLTAPNEGYGLIESELPYSRISKQITVRAVIGAEKYASFVLGNTDIEVFVRRGDQSYTFHLERDPARVNAAASKGLPIPRSDLKDEHTGNSLPDEAAVMNIGLQVKNVGEKGPAPEAKLRFCLLGVAAE